MLLGLYDDDGKLNHVGFTSSFNPQMKKDLKKILEPLQGGSGFTGNAPGGPVVGRRSDVRMGGD